MKKNFLILLLATILSGAEHLAKVEPFEIYSIKSAVNAKVIKSDLEKEGQYVKDFEVIRLDDVIDKINLKTLQDKLKNSEEILKVDSNILKNLEELVKIKKDNYERIKNLKTKSKFEKDAKLSDYLLTYNQYLNQLEKIKNLKIQIKDIKLNIEKLKDTLVKKSIKVDGYIYKIYVKKGDFAGIGAKLVDVADISKGKIVIYLDKDEMQGLEKKKIYIDGKETDLKFYKIFKISDPVHISAYRAEILVKSPKIFSKLVKVEVK